MKAHSAKTGTGTAFFCREVGHSGRIPPGWRMAWYEPRRRLGVYCLAPFHWLKRICRDIVRRLRLA